MTLFFKRGSLFLFIIALVVGIVLGTKIVILNIGVQDVHVSGNYHLDAEDIIADSKIRIGEPLLKVDLDDVQERLRQNAWIREVALKKKLPGTLLIKVSEAVPKALLNIKKNFYLMDGNGKTLERIHGVEVPFLPIIKDIDPNDRKDMAEALKLVDALAGMHFMDNRDSVEIGIESYGLTMHIDGELIKIGYGQYEEKFNRWIELEPEIRKRGLPIKYVDLRFKDSVIVKPLTPVKGKQS